MSANVPPQAPENPTPPPPPPPPEPPSRGRLLRSTSDRMLAGVAGGLGRYFGVDPVIIRIALVVLTFFGGAGALLYLAAVLLVPSEAEVPGGAAAAPPPGERLGDRHRGLVILGVVLLVIVAGPLLFGPALFAGGLIVPLAFLVLIGLAISWLVTGDRPGRDPGSILRATLVGLGLLVVLTALAVGSFWGAGIGGDAVIAALVIAAGVAVLAGAFLRPVRWLILPALAVALPTAIVAAAGIDLDGGIGERTYQPTSAAQVRDHYEVGTGRLEIDLRRANLPAGERRMDIDVGMGQAVLIVPDDVCVATDARVGVGAASVFERESGGIDVEWANEPGARAGMTRLVVDADIGIGHLDIRKTDPSPRDWDEDGWRGGGWYEESGRGSNTACAP